jgi:hypothetical protein
MTTSALLNSTSARINAAREKRKAAKKRKRAKASQTRKAAKAQYSEDLNLEDIYLAACMDKAQDPSLSYASLVRKYGEVITEDTLGRRFKKISQTPRQAHVGQQLLNPTQEQVLVHWLTHLGLQGRPATASAVIAQVHSLIGVKPSRSWVQRFEVRNPGLIYGSASGLDPQRAQCFNKAAICQHFQSLKQALDMGFETHNIYNVDEQGLQRGSRKKGRRKYFLGRHDRMKYKIRSNNLETTTVIDCVCADGSKLVPSFIFQGKETLELDWWEGHESSMDVVCVAPPFGHLMHSDQITVREYQRMDGSLNL